MRERGEERRGKGEKGEVIIVITSIIIQLSPY